MLNELSSTDDSVKRLVAGECGWVAVFAPTIRIQASEKRNDSFLLYCTTKYKARKDKDAENVGPQHLQIANQL